MESIIADKNCATSSLPTAAKKQRRLYIDLFDTSFDAEAVGPMRPHMPTAGAEKLAEPLLAQPGAVVMASPKRPIAGSRQQPIEIYEATKDELAEQERLYERLVSKSRWRKPSSIASSTSRTASKKKGRARPRATINLDVVPKLPAVTSRGEGTKLQIVVPGMDTSLFPDSVELSKEFAHGNRSIPSEVEHSSNGAVIQQSNRNTGKSVTAYVTSPCHRGGAAQSVAQN